MDLGHAGKLEGSDCELVEQIKQNILPLFTVRKVRMLTTCVPHQPTPGTIALELEVLSAAAPP